MTTTMPPKWKNDAHVNNCDKCSTEFTFFKRRHHCRGCGNIFCDACTSQRCSIAGCGPDPQRVCDECYIQQSDTGHVRYISFSQRPRERKVCLLGHANTGKTSLAHQFVNKVFVEDYTPTISSTLRKVVRRERGDEYELVIVDSAGQSSVDMFKPSLCIGTHGYIIAYSITERATFTEARSIHAKLSECHGDVPVLLVGNKIDLDRGNLERQVSAEEGTSLAAQLGCTFLETSATRQKSVVQMFSILLDMLVDADEKHNTSTIKGSQKEYYMI